MNVKIGLCALLLVAGALHVRAGEIRLESAGTRVGTSKIGANAQFYQVEGFANWTLPCRWDWNCGCHLQWRLDLTAGWINGRGDDAFIGTVGPTFELGRDGLPVVVELGCSPTILSREEFGRTDFGIPFQFTTHASVLWRVGSRVTIEGRFQHMSNANIGPSNPGLNLYMLGVGWRF